MPRDVYVQDGVVYPDEATAVVAMHPNIPESIKGIFIRPVPKDNDQGMVLDPNINDLTTRDDNVVTPNDAPLENAPLLDVADRRPVGSPTEPAGAFKSKEGTGVPPAKQTLPEPSQGLVEPGNINLDNRPVVRNSD